MNQKKRQSRIYRVFSAFVALSFAINSVIPPAIVSAQILPSNNLNLPAPGTMISPSNSFEPVIIKGVTIDFKNPMKFDFIIDTGDVQLEGQALTEEATKLVKYFLASLAIPEKDLWVNLSPYEKNRIISEQFSITDMGRDLLAQDYILKQITASLIYPESELGKEFWRKVQKRAYEKFGVTNITADIFNKVWVVPQKAVVYQKDNTAIVASSRLNVMLEEDFVAGKKSHEKESLGIHNEKEALTHDISAEVIREVVIPILEKEINEGENFATLRQIYQSHILASWYKKALKNSLLGQLYQNRSKLAGIDIEDKQAKEKIYAQYLEAFQKGVYDYIREDYDSAQKDFVPRKYFSGGTHLTSAVSVVTEPAMLAPGMINRINSHKGSLFSIPFVMQSVGGNVDLATTSNTELREKLMAALKSKGYQDVEFIGPDFKYTLAKAKNAQGKRVFLKVEESAYSVGLYDFESEETQVKFKKIESGHPNIEHIKSIGVLPIEVQVKTKGKEEETKIIKHRFIEVEYFDGPNLKEFLESQNKPIDIENFIKFVDGVIKGYNFLTQNEIGRPQAIFENIKVDPVTERPVHINYFQQDSGYYTDLNKEIFFDMLVQMIVGKSFIFKAGGGEKSDYTNDVEKLYQDFVIPRFGESEEAFALAEIARRFINRNEIPYSINDFHRDIINILRKKGSQPVFLALRDLSPFVSGAYTGQTSKALAEDVGATHVVIEEPRKGTLELTGENKKDIALKVNQALEDKNSPSLSPIIKVQIDSDETAWGGNLDDYLYEKLRSKLSSLRLHPDKVDKISIVPVFKNEDGTSAGHVTPSVFKMVAQAIDEMNRKILNELIPRADAPELSGKIRILYHTNSRVGDIQDKRLGENLLIADGVYVEDADTNIINLLNTIVQTREMEHVPVGEVSKWLSPMVVLDFTRVFGDELTKTVEQVRTIVETNTDYLDIETVVVASNLDLRRAGQIVTENKLSTTQPLNIRTNVHFAAQALEDNSPEYLAALKKDGATFVLLHHSERRRHHGITIETAANQARAVYDAELIPVVAIGELEREAGWEGELARQTKLIVAQFTLDELQSPRRVRFAYEPIKFIGTGQTMDTIGIAEASNIISNAIGDVVEKKGGKREEIHIGILYGGSAKPSQAYAGGGGWERSGDVPVKTRHTQHTPGALVGTRSITHPDQQKIGNRYAAGSERFGKPVRGESGFNWKMVVHTLEDAQRRIDPFAKSMAKSGEQWLGESYFVVPASMIQPLVQRYRGPHAPVNIGTLERTKRERAIARVINSFWYWWENEGMDSSPASLDKALNKFFSMYFEDEELRLEGVTWFELYERAILSEFFSDDKTTIPAARFLVKLRFSPLQNVLAEIQGKQFKKLREELEKLFDKRKYLRNLNADEVEAVLNSIANHFDVTTYGRVTLKHTIPEAVRQVRVESAQEVLNKSLRILEDKEAENKPKAVISALWRIRDIIVFDRNGEGLNNLGLDALDYAERKFNRYKLIQNTIKEIRQELVDIDIEEIIEKLEELQGLEDLSESQQELASFSLGRLSEAIGKVEISGRLKQRARTILEEAVRVFRGYPIIETTLESIDVKPHEITLPRVNVISNMLNQLRQIAELPQHQAKGLDQKIDQLTSIYERSLRGGSLDDLEAFSQSLNTAMLHVALSEEEEHVLIDDLRDTLVMEQVPLYFVRQSKEAVMPLIEEANFARIWGIRPLIAHHVLQEIDRAMLAEIKANTSIALDAIEEGFEAKVIDPVEVSLDVTGIFDGPHELALKNAADNFIRRLLGDKRGRSVNPNSELKSINGITSKEELKALVNFVNANPYHGRSQFVMTIYEDYSNTRQEALVRVSFADGSRKDIKVTSLKPGFIDGDDVIFITDEDPDNFARNLPQQENKRFHVVNPLLDSTETFQDINTYHTGFSAAINPLKKVIDEEYGIKYFGFQFATPGERHNLKPLGTFAGRGIQWKEGSQSPGVNGNPHWETHAQQGAGFAQLYLVLDDDIKVDKLELIKTLKVAPFEGEPIYFAEDWHPNSLSVQAHDKPLIVEEDIAVQGNGRLVTIRVWVPDWALADQVLSQIIQRNQLSEQEEHDEDYLNSLINMEQKVRAEQNKLEEPAKDMTAGEKEAIGIYGGDEVAAAHTIKELRGNNDFLLKSIYLIETTENPLDVRGFAQFLKHVMPHSKIVTGRSGDTISINGSSPIKIHIGKAAVPDWEKDGVDTVIFTHKRDEGGDRAWKDHNKMGAKRVVMANNPDEPINHVLAQVKDLFKEQKILGEVVQTNAALDPFRGRGHDIVDGSEIKPAPFANLISSVSSGKLKVESSSYDAHLTTVSLTFEYTPVKADIVEAIQKHDNFVLVNSTEPARPSMFIGQNKLFVNEDNIILTGKTVSILVGYDYGAVWAQNILGRAKTKKQLSEIPKDKVESDIVTGETEEDLKKDRRIIDYIPAPPPKPVKHRSLKQRVATHIAFDLTEVPFDERSRNAHDYFTEMLVPVLMGDNRVSPSFYGVRDRDIHAFHRAVRKRLPEHVSVRMEPEKNSSTDHQLIIDGVAVKVSTRKILDDPKMLVNDEIDSVLVVTTRKKGSEEYDNLNEEYSKVASSEYFGLTGFRIINPDEAIFENIQAHVQASLIELFGHKIKVNVISLKPNRLTEHKIETTPKDHLQIRTPTRLEGEMHTFVMEFDSDKTRGDIESLVSKIVSRSKGAVEQLNRPIYSLDLVQNTHDAVISPAEITGSGRLWSVSLWGGETGLVQNQIEDLVGLAELNPNKAKMGAKTTGKTHFSLPTYSLLAPKKPHQKLRKAGKKADIIISAIGGESGKGMLLATIGDEDVNILGVTINKPTETKVRATIEALNNSTNYGRPGIRFEYGGYNKKEKHFVMYAGTDETGWAKINVYNGQARDVPIERWVAEGKQPIYLHMAGRGYHRFKEKEWHEAGAIVQYGNPGKGARLLLIPGAANWEDHSLALKIAKEDITCVGSCTTGAAVGALAAISNIAEFVSGITLHEFTNDQNINDGPLHDTFERSLAAMRTMTLSSSGAGGAVGESITDLEGRATTVALREGFGGASVWSGVIKVKDEFKNRITLDQIKEMFRKMAAENPGVVGVHEGPFSLDSDLVKGTSYSAFIDLTTLRYDSQAGIIMLDSWYDNVIGFSTRMIDVAKDTTAIRKVNNPLSNTAQVAVDSAMSAPDKFGGIYLGEDNFLEIIDYDQNGIPMFDPAQIQLIEQDFKGLIPVPVSLPIPVSILQLTGLNEGDPNEAAVNRIQKRFSISYFDGQYFENIRNQDDQRYVRSGQRPVLSMN